MPSDKMKIPNLKEASEISYSIEGFDEDESDFSFTVKVTVCASLSVSLSFATKVIV